MTPDPYRYFRPEARDIVEQFAKGVLELENGGGSTDSVQRLLRLAHTLKGAARVVKQTEIAERAHAIEDALAPLRDRNEGIGRDRIDAILEQLDAISGHLAALTAVGGTVAETMSPADSGPRTIRADVAEAEAVINGIAEAHALLAGVRGGANALQQARRRAEMALIRAAAVGVTANSARKPFRRRAIAEELCGQIRHVERNLDSTMDRIDRELRQLREAAERLRLVAASSLFTALERSARDAARAGGKIVKFEGAGGDIRLDADVLETVRGALIQLVRNAVVHGIELTDERVAVGKQAAGHVSVKVYRQGRKIAFECCDDGRGVDVDAVRRAAIQRGMLDATEREGRARDLAQILLRGGISTAQRVTVHSGRGVGLDVVREAVERLGGEVRVRTTAGVGTTFELLVPPSLVSLDALIVEAESSPGGTAAIPLDAIRNTIRLAEGDVTGDAHGAAITVDGAMIPFLPLSAALDGGRTVAGRSRTAIVVAAGGGNAAIGVGRLLGTANIIARPLPHHLTKISIVVGAAMDTDGNPQLILDPELLVAAAVRGTAAEHNAAPGVQPILVIDDSPTTRMLEQSILEAAGFEVDVAVSAEDGLDVLRRKRYALILVDVEMPGIDGFTFMERIRADAGLRDTPAILVTSRSAPEDIQRGRDVGANGYILKSEFDQAALLAMIRRLVGQ